MAAQGPREAIRLTHDALMAARRTIYIETQYLASFGVAARWPGACATRKVRKSSPVVTPARTAFSKRS